MVSHRVRWLLPLLLLLAALALQLFVDRTVSKAAEDAGARVVGGWVPGRVDLARSEIAHGATVAVSLRSASATTRILRRRCSGRLTIGLGATLRFKDLGTKLQLSSSREFRTQSPSLCVDVDFELGASNNGLRLTQYDPLTLDGQCGATLSGLVLERNVEGGLFGKATLTDRARCLSELGALIPGAAEPRFVPQSVDVELSVSGFDWSIRPLKGKSRVALASELATRVRSADLKVQVGVTSVAGEQAELCFRKSESPGRTEFEIGLALTESAFASLAGPWLDGDTRKLLGSLRSDRARCDGRGDGLMFDSEINQLLFSGKELRREPRLADPADWVRSRPCVNRKPAPGDCRYQVAVVEFDEQGGFVAPQQLEQTVAAIEGGGKDGLLLFVFMHGWRHSARTGDSNLRDFSALTESIATMEASSAPEGERPRKVLGVYLAWPAQLYPSTAANKLATFWDRLKIARQLGKSGGALRQTLDALAAATKAGNLLVTDPLRRSAMFVGAHSMGAEALLGAFTDPQRPGTPTGDLVLLVNPAISSARFRGAQARLAAAETPLIVYGAVGDEITQQFYPMGEALTFEGTTREELSLHTTTVANDTNLVTHRLTLVAENHPPPFSPSTLVYGLHRLPRRSRFLGQLVNYWDSQIFRPAPTTELAGGVVPDSPVALEQTLEPWYRLVLCSHKQGDSLRSPCARPMPARERLPAQMVVAVDRAIIKSHASFFTAPFMEHVARVIGASLYATPQHAE